jgi:hypothetical protein
MSVMRIRGNGFSRWSRLTVAGLLLVSSAAVYAQTNEEKEKARKAQPAVQKKGDLKKADQQSASPAQKSQAPATPLNNRGNATAPANTTPAHPPAIVKGGETPARPPAIVKGGETPAHPPAIVKGGETPARQPSTVNTNPAPGRPAGTPGGNLNTGRPAGTPGGNLNANRPAGGAAPVTGRPSHADFHGSNNTQVHYGANGQPRVVQARGMTIVHTPSGVRHVVVERPDHTMIVANGARSGFVQRPYVVGNVSYVQRTYYVGGASYVRVYRPYMFGGISLNLYVPGRYYAPGFYAWAYNPWATPVVYNWGWAGSPWFGFYGGWFTPYPTYTNATFWLTDYVIAMSLQQAYQDRMAAAANAQPYPAGGTPLTPDVKQQIADEVRLQLNEERAAAQNPNAASGVPSFLTDNSAHVFVVSSSLFVMANGGAECPVTEGDVLQMMAPPPPGSPDANVVVLASKRGECRKGSMVSVGITDLADMVSQMRATIDQGLGVLQQHQGGIPAPPPAAQAPPVQPAYASAAPPPDPNVSNEIAQQAQASSQAENDALNQAQQAAPAGNAPTVNISLGMTIDQVVAAMGQPQQIADLGSKKTYFYANMKVIFTDGKVTDVQ